MRGETCWCKCEETHTKCDYPDLVAELIKYKNLLENGEL